MFWLPPICEARYIDLVVGKRLEDIKMADLKIGDLSEIYQEDDGKWRLIGHWSPDDHSIVWKSNI